MIMKKKINGNCKKKQLWNIFFKLKPNKLLREAKEKLRSIRKIVYNRT